MNKVYIAAPFFSEEQIKTVEMIERELDKADIDFFSPRSEGTLIDMTEEERNQAFSNIYKSNIVNMDQCNAMIAVIDDRDLGVAYEMGWFKFKPMFSFSNNAYQINVMLRQAILTHNTDVSDLIFNIKEYYDGKRVTRFEELTKDIT